MNIRNIVKTIATIGFVSILGGCVVYSPAPTDPNVQYTYDRATGQEVVTYYNCPYRANCPNRPYCNQRYYGNGNGYGYRYRMQQRLDSIQKQIDELSKTKK